MKDCLTPHRHVWTFRTTGYKCRTTCTAFYSIFLHLFHLRGKLWLTLKRNCSKSQDLFEAQKSDRKNETQCDTNNSAVRNVLKSHVSAKQENL